MGGEYVVVVRCTLSGENIDKVADPTSFYKHVSFGFGLIRWGDDGFRWISQGCKAPGNVFPHLFEIEIWKYALQNGTIAVLHTFMQAAQIPPNTQESGYTLNNKQVIRGQCKD